MQVGDQLKINSNYNTPPIDIANDSCSVTTIAIQAIKALGLILMTGGIGCFLAGLQVPATALFVTGAVAWVFGFVVDKSEPANSEEIQSDRSLLIDPTLVAKTTIEDQIGIESPLTLDPALIEKINGLATSIIKREDHEQIQWISKGKNYVFRHIDSPDVVFKINPMIKGTSLINGKWMNGPEQIRNRFENIRKGEQVCRVHQLGLLKIPKAELFDIRDDQGTSYPVIAEEWLDIRADSVQEELYRDLAEGLGQSVLQLTTFIAHTGFNDVTWRNIPIVDDALDFQGDRRIALIDLEHMESRQEGIKGSINGSVGLVGCLFSENQIDAVLEKAIHQGIIDRDKSIRLKAKRMEKLEVERKRLEYYKNHDLLNNPGQLIEVNLDTIGLDLNEVGPAAGYYFINNNRPQRMETLRKVAQDVVITINNEIQKKLALIIL